MNLKTFFYLLASIFLGFLIPYAFFQLLGTEIRKPEQQFVNAVWRGSVYSLFALGYALIFSILGLLNLAHSAIFMWGAFIGLLAVTDLGLPLWLALPFGMLGGGLMSVLVDQVAFAPLRKRNAPRIAQLISSIGAAVILVNVASMFFGTSSQRFPQESIDALPIEATKPIPDFPVILTPIQISVLVISLVLMFVLQYMVSSTRTGKAMRVVAFNQQTASLLSIHVSQIFALTFFISGALAGAAGVLQGIAFNSIIYDMGDTLALTGLTVIVIGGMGSIRGAVIGGFLIANIEVMAIAVGYSRFTDAVVFLALFLTLLIRPQGLLGEPVQTRA